MNLTVVQTSLDPEQGSARARRRMSITARIGSMGQNRYKQCPDQAEQRLRSPDNLHMTGCDDSLLAIRSRI